jgi:hypothetical protein
LKEGTLSTDSVVLDAELLATALPGLEQICAEMLQEEGYNFVSLLKNLCAVDFKVKYSGWCIRGMVKGLRQ